MTHHIKLNHHYAGAVLCGDKNFEVRYNDRGYQKGDKVVFSVVDDGGITLSHPLSRTTFEITYVLCGWGVKENWCVFGISPWKTECEWKEEEND